MVLLSWIESGVKTASWCRSSWGWAHCAWHLGEPAPHVTFLLPQEAGLVTEAGQTQGGRGRTSARTCGPLSVAHGGGQQRAFSELSRLRALPAGRPDTGSPNASLTSLATFW